LLDFGCGSLRSGRLLIPYLGVGRYFGIDPNRWLIDAGIEQEIGASILALKQPRFDCNPSCRLAVFGADFDFIHAHSVFTHAPSWMIDRFFAEAALVLKQEGLILATYLEGAEDYQGTEWVYPPMVPYTRSGFASVADRHGFALQILRWPHPQQTYFVAGKKPFDGAGLLRSIRQEYGLDLLPRRGPRPGRFFDRMIRLRNWFAAKLHAAEHPPRHAPTEGGDRP
jgi:SAM-dependent methyltransferase